ncbi:MAG TPA: hypothetical protein VMU86_06595 [Steroidobacteraceae bacterium]|nr:hypothetical protein [Steroidobacteraceae bacterium]
MNLKPWLAVFACAALSGCVLGYGRCLLVAPLRTTLAGTLDFHTYEVDGAVERVALLTADHSQYVYAPAESHLCQMADRFQLSGWGAFPPDLKDGTRVQVSGALVLATNAHQHTHFLMRVRSIDVLAAPPAPKPPPGRSSAPE